MISWFDAIALRPSGQSQAAACGVLKSGPMEITVNGASRQFSAALTVAGLVEALGYAGKRIAVERNGEIVPRGRHADVVLADGDRLEIVVAVGGG